MEIDVLICMVVFLEETDLTLLVVSLVTSVLLSS